MDFERIQTKEVVAIAAIVPVGIDFDASAKSPDRLDPAIMPANIFILQYYPQYKVSSSETRRSF